MADVSDPTLAPWLQVQALHLLRQRGHAWLLQGPSGLGQYELALALASAWLCEHAAPGELACGHCPSCHAIAVRTHADLKVLMPETEMLAQGWTLDERTQKELDDKKRKPSREIRVDAMRSALEFAQRTSGRGRGKVVLIHPADAMNAVTANALLKTLEEPVGDVRFVLATQAADRLLPTVRSRCMAHALHWPQEAQALPWLAEALHLDLAQARVLLRAAGGRPAQAQALAGAGLTAHLWQQFPSLVRRADAAAFSTWSPSGLLDALQKLCHDLMCRHFQSAPRFFELTDLASVGPIDVGALTQWAAELRQAAATVEHPFNSGLMLEARLVQARRTLRP